MVGDSRPFLEVKEGDPVICICSQTVKDRWGFGSGPLMSSPRTFDLQLSTFLTTIQEVQTYGSWKSSERGVGEERTPI